MPLKVHLKCSRSWCCFKCLRRWQQVLAALVPLKVLTLPVLLKVPTSLMLLEVFMALVPLKVVAPLMLLEVPVASALLKVCRLGCTTDSRIRSNPG